MIPSLFFLLIILIIGVVVYVYLRQEQDNFIKPKDKYDEAWNEVFTKRQNKRSWIMRSEAILSNANSSSISLGLGLLSCITLLFYFDVFVMYTVLISCIGSFAAIAGLSIGVFGGFQARNESLLIRYGGSLLSIIGLMNLINFGGFLLISSFFGWLIWAVNK